MRYKYLLTPSLALQVAMSQPPEVQDNLFVIATEPAVFNHLAAASTRLRRPQY